MNGVVHPPTRVVVDGITSLVGPFEHSEFLTAELNHLRHEGQSFELALPVKRSQDFLFAPDLDQLAGVQLQGVHHSLKVKLIVGPPARLPAKSYRI
jgi:hypothetical protein